jgi:hypothetical protein
LQRELVGRATAGGQAPGAAALVLDNDWPGAGGGDGGAEGEGGGQVGAAADAEPPCAGDGQQAGQVGEERGERRPDLRARQAASGRGRPGTDGERHLGRGAPRVEAGLDVQKQFRGT